MSSFYAYDFIYDDIPSQKYGLRIITFEDGGLFNGVGSSDVEILSQRVMRKSKPYFLGRTQSTVLQFPLTFGTAYPISGLERDQISKWLFGRSAYKKLYILQDDLNGAYFNCFMTAPQPLYIGNINYAFTCTVLCDSPWAYSAPHVVSGSFTGLPDNLNKADYYLDIYNYSSEDEYLYPTLEFTMEYYGHPGNFVVENYSDYVSYEANYRKTMFNDMPGTTGRIFYIKMDNDLQILDAKDVNGHEIVGAMQYFNKQWLRLVPGLNKLGFMVGEIGDTARFRITWTERLKIGG